MKAVLSILMFLGLVAQSAYSAESFRAGLGIVRCDSICSVVESVEKHPLIFKEISKFQNQVISRAIFFEKNISRQKKIFYAQIEIVKTEKVKEKTKSYAIAARIFQKGQLPEQIWPQFRTTVSRLEDFTYVQVALQPIFEGNGFVVPRLSLGKRDLSITQNAPADVDMMGLFKSMKESR